MAETKSESSASPQSALNKLLTTVGDAIADAAAMEVITLTGNIRQVIKPGEKVVALEELMNKLMADEANVSLVAATMIKIDGDTTLFVSEAPNAELLISHKEAVAAAQKYRTDIVSAVIGIFDLK